LADPDLPYAAFGTCTLRSVSGWWCDEHNDRRIKLTSRIPAEEILAELLSRLTEGAEVEVVLHDENAPPPLTEEEVAELWRRYQEVEAGEYVTVEELLKTLSELRKGGAIDELERVRANSQPLFQIGARRTAFHSPSWVISDLIIAPSLPAAAHGFVFRPGGQMWCELGRDRGCRF
jgi:hypothetical protein